MESEVQILKDHLDFLRLKMKEKDQKIQKLTKALAISKLAQKTISLN
jgi:hypothetical protein